MRKFRVLFGVILAAATVVLTGPLAGAEQIEVRFTGSQEVYKLELEEGESADIAVHMKSVGDSVKGYLVILMRSQDSKELLGLYTDVHGIALFREVPAGDYSIFCRKLPGQGNDARVSIGDVVVKKSVPDEDES